MHAELFRAHFVTGTGKVNFEGSVNVVLNNGPVDVNIWLFLVENLLFTGISQYRVMSHNL